MFTAIHRLSLSFTNRFCSTISLFTMFTFLQLTILPNNAESLGLQVENVTSHPGETVSVRVSVTNYSHEKIAAAAFTLTYNADYLTLTNVDSTFFDSFMNQWNILSPPPVPLPDTGVVVDGKTYSTPLIHNTISSPPLNKTLIAGVRVRPGTPSSLLTFTFTVSNSAPAAIYPVSIQPTILRNTNAGYSPSGETVPILTDCVENENDYSLAYPTYSPSIINGTIAIDTVIVDSDSDGLEDSWELSYFNDIDTANSSSDFDKDGYTDLQEYLNYIASLTDPEGTAYNPITLNAPGGTGYNPPLSNSAFWNLILPCILNASGFTD